MATVRLEATLLRPTALISQLRPPSIPLGNTFDSDKSLAPAEPRRFGSLDEALAFLGDKRVDALRRKRMDEWRRLLGRNINVDLADASPKWPYVTEIFQRRNVVVHDGGQLSRRYLAAVAPEVIEALELNPAVGATADHTDDSISASLANVKRNGARLLFAFWDKLAADD